MAVVNKKVTAKRTAVILMPVLRKAPNVVRNIMRPQLFILFCFIQISSFGQMRLNDITDKSILDRIEFIKVKTDSFLLGHFNARTKSKFKFEFLKCGYLRGEFRSVYERLNIDKPEPLDLNNLTHHYSFIDKDINLLTDIDVYYFEVTDIEIRFQTSVDSLKYEALNKIYNQGLLPKIMRKINETRLKDPFVIIEVDKIKSTFNIILKDKNLPHNFFIS